METFFSLLERRVEACGSLLCVGLDPHPQMLPQVSAEAALKFCFDIIHETAPYAAAFKPNAAFFEAFGAAGWQALRQVIACIQDESQRLGSKIPIILDAKRGDIASTARAYVRSAFEHLGVDAITLNPYLGYDALAPFLTTPEKGVFLLCKTSNPGSADLQDLPLDGGLLYEHVARLAQSWNKNGNLGLVVGATHPQALAKVRAAAHDLWFLSPGVGAQGGDLESALRAGLRRDGLGMLINVSRGIAGAQSPRQAASALRDAIAELRPTISPLSDAPVALPHADLADDLLAAGCVRFGEFTLKSGQVSPIYIDLRRLVASPPLMRKVAAAYANLLSDLTFDVLAALPYAALPIGTAVSLLGNWPLIYPRKETKAYGTRATIEGLYQSGQRAVVLDDLITTGGSKLEGIEKLTAAGLEVRDIVVLIDRQSGGVDFMVQQGYRLHSVFTLLQLLDYWEAQGAVEATLIARARAFVGG